MDRLLVVGATGLLGSEVERIASAGYEVSGTYTTNKAEGLLHLDVVDVNETNAVIEKVKPDIVFDTHTFHSVDYCETHKDGAWSVNVEGTKNIASAAKRVGARYIFISTDYVFSGEKSSYTEADRTDPINYFGVTKAKAEAEINQLDGESLICRTSSLYGAGSSTGKRSFVPWLVDQLTAGKSVDVVADLYQSPTLNSDLARIALDLAERGKSGMFHVVGSNCIAKYDFATRIAIAFGLDSGLLKPIKLSEFSKGVRRPHRVSLSTAKLKDALGKVPVGVDEGLKIIRKSMAK